MGLYRYELVKFCTKAIDLRREMFPVLMYGKIEQANTPQKIKLNNEVGMDWVRRNFESVPAVVKPNLSR
jgi:hypothetical protein